MEAAFPMIHEAMGLFARGELSAIDLTQAHLERIRRLNPGLNCFITVTEETALESSRQAQAGIESGSPLRPLQGIPMSLKDLYETAGVLTTHGSSFYADYVPQADACVVEKLKAAGMVLLGKNNMHEIALGVTNVNPHFGPSRNPWDPHRITGGSSGGSAGALAAGLCMGTLGSDTGGSIRIPASLCGVVGLKPTYGRVSLRGVLPLSWNLDHAGPMARCVRDVAILLAVIAGYDPDDPASADIPVDDYLSSLDDGIAGWRIALPMDDFFKKIDSQVEMAVQAAVQVFRDLGARVEPVSLPEAYAAAAANPGMVTSDAAAFHQERLQSHPEGFGADVRQRLQEGAARTAPDYALLRREQSRLRRHFERFFQAYDVLLTPTTPVAAPPIEGPDAVQQARLLTRFTAPFNFTGLPALSLPCGFTEEGLPIGLQMIARPWGEAALLRAAQAFEGVTGWHLRHPELDG